MIKYNLAEDSFGPEEIEAVNSVMKSGFYTMGQKVAEFELALAQWCGSKHALMVNSGSSANLLVIESLVRRALQRARLEPGDEVIVPALSWPTTVWPLVQLGLVPVFVDVDPHTLAIDAKSAARSITPKTKALFLIHVLGLAADMDQITALCNKHKLSLIEDCCDSFGAFYKGKHVGLFGVAGTLSHFFSHHLTTMEGGTIITDDTELYDDLKSFRAHGWIRDRSDKKDWLAKYPDLDPRFFFVSTGYNVRPMEIQGAIGLVQLKKMEQMLALRDRSASRVKGLLLKHAPFIELIGSSYSGSNGHYKERRHSWMNLPFLISQEAKMDRKTIMGIFENCGVETRPIIAGNLTKHPAVKGIKYHARDSLAVCDRILEMGFMIGCHPYNSEEQFGLLEKAIQSVGSRLVFSHEVLGYSPKL